MSQRQRRYHVHRWPAHVANDGERGRTWPPNDRRKNSFSRAADREPGVALGRPRVMSEATSTAAYCLKIYGLRIARGPINLRSTLRQEAADQPQGLS